MLTSIKDYIKTKPRLYDYINSMRPVSGEVENWLENYSRKNRKQVNFIQIGASDGLRWDPFRRFIIRDKWNGVFVEPLPNVFSILKDNYSYLTNQKFDFVNAVISTGNEDYIDIWSFSEKFCSSLTLEDRLFYLRKSSLDKQHVEACLQDLENTSEKIECFHVKCISINVLLRKYFSNKTIDYILIDAEGHDDKIVRTIDFDEFQPEVILFESHNFESRMLDIFEYLTGKGYSVQSIGGDSVAVRN